jgi:Ni/Co efflux regulator RcnB
LPTAFIDSEEQMQRVFRVSANALALAIAVMLVTDMALAEKPSLAGKGKDKDRGDGASRGGDVRVSIQFDTHQQTVVREYYGNEFKAGHCPPGLAKKKNGCMPPGQAKKWRRGAPLPRDVVFYDLPPKLVVEIGLPPAGHRYVRVANDILLIAVGTGMVLDAIEDLNRM